MIKMLVLFCLGGIPTNACTPETAVYEVDGPYYNHPSANNQRTCLEQAKGFEKDAEIRDHITRIQVSLSPEGMTPPVARLFCLTRLVS